MLVLSRRVNERIIFPTLGISIQVIRLASNRASLGIKAPPEIQVIRQELRGDAAPSPRQTELADAIESQVRRKIQHQINALARSLQSVQDELENGDIDHAVDQLGQIRSAVDELRVDAAAKKENISTRTNTLKRSRELPGGRGSDWSVGETVSESRCDYAVETFDSQHSDVPWVAVPSTFGLDAEPTVAHRYGLRPAVVA